MTIDPTTNFWDNSQMKVMYKEEFKSKVPSNVMWALFLIHHPASEYFELPLSIKTKLISKDFLEEESFDFTPYNDTADKIKTYSLTKTKASLVAWETKLEERDNFIKSQPYDFNTYEALDKMMAQTYKLWEQYKSIKSQLEKEEATSMGDIELSMADKGQLF